MSDTFSGFEKVNNPHWSGAPIRIPGAPPRLILHTTEVPQANMRRLAETHPNPPHCWANPWDGEKLQSVRRGHAARALSHPSGTIETNHMGHCVQVELHLRAAETPHLPDEILKWIGESVVWGLCLEAGISFDNVWLPTRGPEAYGVNGPARMSNAQWTNFHGITTHQAVPVNSHWDAGAINLARIMEHVRAFNPFGDNGGINMSAESDIAAIKDGLIDQYPAAGGRSHNHGFAIQNGHAILHRLEPIIKAMASKVAGLPTEAASTAEVVAASEHVIDTLIEALDGLEIDGNVATGDDARRLIAELIGATIP